MSKHDLSPSQQKQKVNERLKLWDEAPITRQEWDDVRDDLGEIGIDVERALDMVRSWRQKRKSLRPLQVQDDPGHALHRLMWARSLLLANSAEQDDKVRRFRQEILDGRLISTERVGAWVERHRVLEGPPTKYARVALVTGESIAAGEIVHWSIDELKYSSDGEWVEVVAVRRGGVLDQLRQLSERLESAYLWQKAQASVFVLTGATPVLQMLTVARSVSSAGLRVKIEADPDVPSKLVDRQYKKARREMIGPKARAPFPRGVELVIHAAERPGVKVGGLWKQWNRDHPNQPYSDKRAFAQALRDARRRIESPEVRWESALDVS